MRPKIVQTVSKYTDKKTWDSICYYHLTKGTD